MGVIPDWIQRRLGIGGGGAGTVTGSLGATTGGSELPSLARTAGAQRTAVGGQIDVNFRDAPRGTQVAAQSANPQVPISTNTGFALGEAGSGGGASW